MSHMIIDVVSQGCGKSTFFSTNCSEEAEEIHDNLLCRKYYDHQQQLVYLDAGNTDVFRSLYEIDNESLAYQRQWFENMLDYVQQNGDTVVVIGAYPPIILNDWFEMFNRLCYTNQVVLNIRLIYPESINFWKNKVLDEQSHQLDNKSHQELLDVFSYYQAFETKLRTVNHLKDISSVIRLPDDRSSFYVGVSNDKNKFFS